MIGNMTILGEMLKFGLIILGEGFRRRDADAAASSMPRSQDPVSQGLAAFAPPEEDNDRGFGVVLVYRFGQSWRGYATG
jgi:hypothetical protein